MPKLKRLSGKEVIKIFGRFGFKTVARKGSHVKLKRIIKNEKQILTVPDHKEMDTGTLKAVINQASVYIDPSELKPYFYSE